MSGLIQNPNQITTDWLTEVLHNRGVLPQGSVTSIQHKSEQTNTAVAISLDVAYSDIAPPSAPKQLFLKMAATRHEAEFYNVIASTMEELPLLDCYDAAYSPDVDQAHLLFADLSQTHIELPEAMPPTQVQVETCLRCLAQVHAHWWKHPRLSTDINALSKKEDITGVVRDMITKTFPDFADYLGDRLSTTRRDIYEKVLSAWPLPKRQQRVANGEDITLVHGDAHTWNFLFPRNPTQNKVWIIDWRAWHIGIGTNDLAYMMAMHWYPEQRARMEKSLVKSYHNYLHEYAVSAYKWEQCWFDYRVSVIETLVWPIFHWAVKTPPNIWWHNLERIMLAYEDLDCAELLAS